jgi:mannosyltransferase PIG-V
MEGPGSQAAIAGATREDGPPASRAAITLLVTVWLAWSGSLLVFQELVQERFQVERPDTVLSWTASETGLRRHAGRPYLGEPMLNSHVAFDSEYYLSIAVLGYDDPDVGEMQPGDGSPPIPLNYAFMPFYPLVVRAVAAPLGALGLGPLAAATVAGVAVSLAATLAAMISLFLIARRRLGDSAGLRAAIFLLIFPSGFFLAQVYTEALFLALALGSLAFLDARRPLLAALCAVLATWTRPIGVALALPIAIAMVEWLRTQPGLVPRRWARRETLIWGVAALAPVAAYVAWAISPLGEAFSTVQREYFGQQPLAIGESWENWMGILAGWSAAHPETRVYYGLEVAAVALALVASLWAIRRWPGIALFGLVALLIPLTSGAPQSMVRYALAVPSIFLLLARLGASPAFDRAWMVVSTLLMGLLVTLFAFDFWVA